MKKLSQKGFTLVEGLLVIIALSLVVGVGYYVYSSGKDNQESKAAQVVSTKPDNKSAKSEVQKDEIKIPELGVKLTNLPANLKDVTYTVETSKPSAVTASVKLTTGKLEDLAASCSFGHLNRYSGANDPSMNEGGLYHFIKQDADSWLGFVHNGVPCNEAATQLQGELDVAFQQYIKTSANLQPIK